MIPKLKDFTFKGFVNIEAEIESATNSVTLHVGNIIIDNISILIYDIQIYNPISKYDNITEKFTIYFDKTYEKGTNLSINIEYHGVLSDNMIGFYRSSYVDENQIK